jgi:hypothetical protein
MVPEWYHKNGYYSVNTYVNSKNITRENVERYTINNNRNYSAILATLQKTSYALGV